MTRRIGARIPSATHRWADVFSFYNEIAPPLLETATAAWTSPRHRKSVGFQVLLSVVTSYFVAFNKPEAMVLLLVDDNADDIEVFYAALKQIDESAKCIAAYNGQQALSILESALVPDFIFLDIDMPGLTEIDILREIRKSKLHKKVPVIVFSASISPKEIKTYKKAGVNGFLVKSKNVDEMYRYLSEVLKKN